MKKCSKCKTDKTYDEFYPLRGKINKGLQSWCKTCQKEERKIKWHSLSFEDQLQQTLKRHRRNLTVDEYKVLLKLQDGRCLICRSDGGRNRLVVDHNHETGEVRGLLCSSCNRGLGIFEDDPDLLEKAMMYLRDN